MREPSRGLAQSVQTRLVTHAKGIGVDPNVVLARYATERLLHRLSRSRHADRFVLKGGLMLVAWLGEFTRPTRDADLLGFGDLSPASLDATFREICETAVAPDGMTFDVSTLRIAPIRHDDDYGGWRVVLVAQLGAARLRVQVDIGIGDAVEPPPMMLDYPSLLDAPRPRLRAYLPETAIAEKFHAMVELGEANSRMRDFYDIRVLAERRAFDGATLAGAISSTFKRHGPRAGVSGRPHPGLRLGAGQARAVVWLPAQEPPSIRRRVRPSRRRSRRVLGAGHCGPDARRCFHWAMAPQRTLGT